jgi:tetratricopeptide (TPR) repeat protein
LAPIAWIGSDQWRLSMKRLFVQYICISVAMAYLLGIGSLAAQVNLSQPISKETAQALQKEQQASELAAKGRIAEAETIYKQALATIEKELPRDPILAGSLNNFGQFYRAQRRFSEAAELLNRALAIYVATYGDNHTLTATVINNLAGTYLSDRKFDAAEPLYKRGLAATERLLGPDHYSVAISLDWLAQTNFFQGRYAEAEAHLKRAIAVAEKSTGPESKLVVGLLDHMISVLKAQGREQEASALKERALQIAAKNAKR